MVNGAAAEPGGTASPGRRTRWLPASALEFVGCVECPMTLADYRALPDEKVELFDLETERAWRVAEGPEETHEHPLVMFRKFLVRVEMMRGAPIMFGGAAGLRLLDTDRELVRVMHPDEMVFLDPEGLDRIGSQYAWATDQEHPDVALEVDDTTDVRRNKLLVYADWGFPELWVEVPEAHSPSLPRGLRPGLTIYPGGSAPRGPSRAGSGVADGGGGGRLHCRGRGRLPEPAPEFRRTLTRAPASSRCRVCSANADPQVRQQP